MIIVFAVPFRNLCHVGIFALVPAFEIVAVVQRDCGKLEPHAPRVADVFDGNLTRRRVVDRDRIATKIRVIGYPILFHRDFGNRDVGNPFAVLEDVTLSPSAKDITVLCRRGEREFVGCGYSVGIIGLPSDTVPPSPQYSLTVNFSQRA